MKLTNTRMKRVSGKNDSAKTTEIRSYPLRNSSKSIVILSSVDKSVVSATTKPLTIRANTMRSDAAQNGLTVTALLTNKHKLKLKHKASNNFGVESSFPFKTTRSKRYFSHEQSLVTVGKELHEDVSVNVGDNMLPQAVTVCKKYITGNSNVPVIVAASDGAAASLNHTRDTNNSSDAVNRPHKRSKKKYVCQICDKQFLGGNDLRKHIRIHTGERPFACQHCDKRFRQGGCLKNHIASQHGTTDKFICDYCQKAFPIKERLRLHLRLHSGEKPYTCELCGKSFARGGQLTQHLVTHSGTKKYCCKQCPSSFSEQNNYKLHVKNHAISREYLCHLCKKSFTRPDALRKHLACIHQNVKAFFCHICSRTFKGHLPQHMRTHDNVKMHACNICGTTFSQKSQLIVHHRIHSGERPYRCQVCRQAFAHSSVLKLHIRKHTGEKPFKCMMCTNVETAFSQLPHLKTHMRAIHGMDKAYKCVVCSDFFKTKQELAEHMHKKCAETMKMNSRNNTDQMMIGPGDPQEDITTIALSKLRLLVAVLLKKISTQDRLKKLGFDKRLIDNVLIASLQLAEQPVCEDEQLSDIERLRINVNQFLEWTIPAADMIKLRHDYHTPEEVLENLASRFHSNSETKTNNIQSS